MTQRIGHDQIKEDPYMLCWSVKWLGKKIVSRSLLDFPAQFKKDPRSDYYLAKEIWPFIDRADIIVGHNSDNFDLKWINGLFILHGLPQPSPYRKVDTYKSLNKYARFISHSLKYACRKLSVGHKMDTGGFDLWPKCMDGDEKAMKKMVRYCESDTKITEKLYVKLRPSIQNHPNMNVYEGGNGCPLCMSINMRANGKRYSMAGFKQGYVCGDCGKRFTLGKTITNTETRN